MSDGLVESTGTERAPYKGLIYADAQSGAVVRIELECEIPKESEYQELEVALDYQMTEIDGRPFPLPSHYRLRSLREVGRARNTRNNVPREARRFIQENNETDYKDYRKFEAQSGIEYGGKAGPGR